MTYLFARSSRLAPADPQDSMAWAVQITEKVNDITGLGVTLWASTMSPDTGTLVWSAVVEDLAALRMAEDQLLADGGYLELAGEGARFNDGNGITDGLVRLVHRDPEGVGSAQYASITTALLAPGHMADGIAQGVEMAQRMKAITGRPATFGTSVTGPLGEVGFIILSDTIDQVQTASEALAADADWMALIDEKASAIYQPGATRRIRRRIA